MSNLTKTGVCVARFILFLLSRIFHLLFGGLLRVVRGVNSQFYPSSFLFLFSLLFLSVFLSFFLSPVSSFFFFFLACSCHARGYLQLNPRIIFLESE